MHINTSFLESKLPNYQKPQIDPEFPFVEVYLWEIVLNKKKGGKALCIEIFITGSIIYMLLYNMYSFNKYLSAYYVEGCVLGPVEQNRLNPFSYL